MDHVIELVSSYTDEASGVTESVKKICESVINAGKQAVTLAALDGEALVSPPKYLQSIPPAYGLSRLGHSPRMFRWLNQKARSGSVDLIHSHSLWMMPSVYPGHFSKLFKIPFVISPHGTLSDWAFSSGSFVKKIYWPLLQKPALSVATCFHATAMLEYENIRKMGFSQPVAIIPNGIDIPVLQHSARLEKRTLLFLGRVHPVKGLDMLLPAWSALQDRFPEWNLKIAGPDNGGYLKKMQRLSSQLGLQRIEFTGPLYGKEKWAAYQAADLFVLPSYTENFGISVAEALASGTPAIVTKGAPWEMLEKQDAGMWIDIGLDPLIAAFETMMAFSSERLSTMGLSGRGWMQKKYSWKHIGMQMADTYQWVINGGDKPDWVLFD